MSCHKWIIGARPAWPQSALAVRAPGNTLGVLALLLCLVATSLVGCATFEIETPDEMVAVEESNREYVAMTHDGVVLRVLVHSQGEGVNDVPRAGHDFWVESVRERMRTRGGYALLEEREVQSVDGHRGTRMEFGRDQDGVPYQYWMVLFVTEDNIHVIDAGGRQDRLEGARDALERALSSYEVKR